MDKNRVDKYISSAVTALEECGIAKNGEIVKTFRGQISSFGAAVTMGSFKQAVAAFSKDAQSGNSVISRSKLIEAIHYVIYKEKLDAEKICKQVLQTPASDINCLKERYLDAAVALKLAMNAYDLKKADK